ncbi:MAG: uroporphyrinogen-III C-methyltransferase [Chloroflexota bacterium]|nr:MAG: uroporphyrinogen-III C-methyltransferase [Chloroflexota bacterium]
MSPNGIAYLIGSGPGDPGLITVKGLDCLRRADVILYDRLIASSLLDEAPARAERIFVGKESGRHIMPQHEISALLVRLVAEGKVVARLKGGDPVLFGRGGEEAEALAEAGLPFEIVPGVTSAIGAPTYAGIPLTHRSFASTLAIVTGHEDPSKPGTRIDWRALTDIGTLVVLMGHKKLPSIVAQLLEHGRTPETPIALVQWGTHNRQRVLVSTLSDVIEEVRRVNLGSPMVAVVGEVVNLREKLRWFDNRPLFGKRVLVTRAKEQAGTLSALLERHGAEPVEFPVIQMVPPDDLTPLDTAMLGAARYDWVVFTSVNGVKAVIDRLYVLQKDVRVFGSSQLCAIGPATANELGRHGLRPDLMPKEYVAESILESIGDVAGQHVLLPRADIAREALAVELAKRGAQVDEVVAYRTIPSGAAGDTIRAMLVQGELDIITFTSSSTVRNFMAALEGGKTDNEPGQGSAALGPLLAGVKIACIGPITAQTIAEYGLTVHIQAREYTIPGLVDAILEAEKETR